MEGSVLSPTSWEKRRAWLRQSRHWQTQVLEEEAAAALQDVSDPEPSSLDDVFQEGNPINKIEDWLQDCGYSEEGFFEETGQSGYNGCLSHGTSFEDDLTLGAEATLLATNGKVFSRSFLETARPCQLLDLGCSLASSSMTGGTNKTSSSISEILDKVQEDAEDVLFSLGFGQEDHKDTSRIPARFFTTPSQAKGIDFQLFLKSQVRRIEMEDPCLMLATTCPLRPFPTGPEFCWDLGYRCTATVRRKSCWPDAPRHLHLHQTSANKDSKSFPRHRTCSESSGFREEPNATSYCPQDPAPAPRPHKPLNAVGERQQVHGKEDRLERPGISALSLS